MKRIIILAASILVFLPIVANAAEYKIDESHSKIVFKVKHLGISNVTGSFAKLDGSFNYDPKKPEASTVAAKVDVNSIDTQNQKRDNHLQSSDFLKVKEFPEITFKSKEIKDATKDGFKIVGDLTIKGVTKEIVLDTEVGGMAKDPWGNERAAFLATAKLNRKDFGVTYNKTLETGGLLIGEELKVEVEIEGIKQ